MPRLVLPLGTATAFALAFALSSTEAAADYYGAIAFSQDTGAIGYSYDYRSRAAAEERALNECDGACTVVVWFRNACGAIATGDNNGYGSAWAANRRQAENIALENCNNYAENCSVRRWVCTTR